MEICFVRIAKRNEHSDVYRTSFLVTANKSAFHLFTKVRLCVKFVEKNAFIKVMFIVMLDRYIYINNS